MSEYCVNCEQMSRDLAKARDDVALLADRIKELEAALEAITHGPSGGSDADTPLGLARAVISESQRIARAALYPKEATR